MLTIAEISSKYRTLKAGHADRDATMSDIHDVRHGNIELVFPSMFSDDFPKPVISNFIDIAARDFAEQLAPLPAFNCSSSNMVSDKARAFADKKSKAIAGYLLHAQFQRQMYVGADYLISYGFLPIVVEPDFKAKMPRPSVVDPRGSYYELDRYGKCLSFTKVVQRTVLEICAMYPEHAAAISNPYQSTLHGGQSKIDLVIYRDADQYVVLLPDVKDLLLAWLPNRLGECPVVIVERPHVTDKPRGQYDDVLWIQVARNRFAMLAMQAAEQVVDAPIALPYDVQEFALGPQAAIRTNSPEKIHKVAQELPIAAFQEGQMLDSEMHNGARYPGVRTGNLDSSIITGQGVKALEGGFDSQVRALQDVLATGFTEMIRLCFTLDEKHWPNTERSIRGLADGVPFEIKWKASRDINGDTTVDVSYGFASGLDPNRALVFILQMLGGGLISKDLARRQFPFNVNVTQEEQRIEVEAMRGALIQSISAYAQTVPLLAEQGQDPGNVLSKLSAIIKGRMKGTQIEDVISAAFAPPPSADTGSGGPDMGAPGDQGGGPPQGMQDNGLPQGVAPGQAQMGPGGSPDLMQMLAGLNGSGAPSSTANVRRRLPLPPT